MISPDTYTGRIYSAGEARMSGYVPVFGQKKQSSAAPVSQNSQMNSSAAKSADQPPEKEGGFLSFVKGVIDIINPLQHIPVVSALYRQITGDEIHALARIAGDGLYGGVVGAGLGMADVAMKEITGKDSGETMMAALRPSSATDTDDQAVQLAAISAPKISEIIWTTPAAIDAPVTPVDNVDTRVSMQDFLLPHTQSPTTSAAFVDRKDSEPSAPHTRSYTRTVQAMKGTDDPTEVSLTAASTSDPERIPGRGHVDLTPALDKQDAPVRSGFTPVPPELIAQKMMEALDKYQAMKQPSTLAQADSSFSAAF